MNTERQIQYYLDSLGVRVPASEFILRLSNLYHEAESAYYDRVHPELLDALVVWRQTLDAIASELPARIRVLDVGAGTGFASAAVHAVLGDRIDTLVCLDPSRAMLEKARRRLVDVRPAPSFVVGDIASLLATEPRFDLVVTNSVLHHLPDVSAFLTDVGRLVKPNGFYVAGHEPSREFFEHAEVMTWTSRYRTWRRLRSLLDPKRLWQRLGRQTASMDPEAATATALLKHGLIDRPLPPGTIRQFIDIHVPSSGGTGLGLGLPGFSPDDLMSSGLQGFRGRITTSYSHIKESRARMGPLWRRIDRWLASRHPTAGSNFTLAAQRLPGAPLPGPLGQP